MLQPIEASCLARLPGIRHGFFTRVGGVSQTASMRASTAGRARRTMPRTLQRTARASRTIWARQADDLVTLYQVHGATALCVEGPVAAQGRPKADAVVTRTPGLAVAVLTADCTPVLLADPEARVVAAAHAGWRGAVAGIVESAIAEMERQGARRERIRAAIGPTISQAAYEVGPDFEAELLQGCADNERFFLRNKANAQGAFRPAGICRGAAHCGAVWSKLNGKAPAPTRTNRFFSAFGALSTAKRPITAVK